MKMSEPFDEKVDKYIKELEKILGRMYYECKHFEVLIEQHNGEEEEYHFSSDEHSRVVVNGRGVDPFLDGLRKIKCDEDLDEDEVEMGKEMFSSLPIKERQLVSTRENYKYLLIIFEIKNIIKNLEYKIPKEGQEMAVFVIDDFKWDITIIDIENRETLFSTSEYLSKNI